MRYRIEVDTDGTKKYVKGIPGDFALTPERAESTSLSYPQACEIMGMLDYEWDHKKDHIADKLTLILLGRY